MRSSANGRPLSNVRSKLILFKPNDAGLQASLCRRPYDPVQDARAEHGAVKLALAKHLSRVIDMGDANEHACAYQLGCKLLCRLFSHSSRT